MVDWIGTEAHGEGAYMIEGIIVGALAVLTFMFGQHEMEENERWRITHCNKGEHFYNSRGICEPCGHKEGQ